jgi:serine/threonine protein kinase
MMKRAMNHPTSFHYSQFENNGFTMSDANEHRQDIPEKVNGDPADFNAAANTDNYSMRTITTTEKSSTLLSTSVTSVLDKNEDCEKIEGNSADNKVTFVGGVIGKGEFCTVVSAYRNNNENQKVAVKYSTREEHTHLVQNELKIFAKLKNHNNLSQCYGVVKISKQSKKIGIILKFYPNGTLGDFIFDPSKEIDQSIQYRMAQEAALAIAVLHELDIIHTDIHSGNFLLDESLTLKLCDFGGAFKASKPPKNGSKQMMNMRYSAPEIITGEQFSKGSDVYSLALVFCEIFHREKVYRECEKGNSPKVIMSGSKPPINDSKCPTEMKKLCYSMWHNNPKQRPSAQDVSENVSKQYNNA